VLDRPSPDDPLGNDLIDRLDRWAADARVDEAVQRRTRERWLRHQADQAATFTGVLVDLAERGAPVALQLLGGTSVVGALRTIGADFCALRVAGTTSLVVLDAVSTVRGAPASSSLSGDRVTACELRFVDVVSELANDRERVHVVPAGAGAPLTGQLRAVGQDIATIRCDGDPPATVYVRLAAVGHLSLA
jgi:hypothetical protein